MTTPLTEEQRKAIDEYARKAHTPEWIAALQAVCAAPSGGTTYAPTFLIASRLSEVLAERDEAIYQGTIHANNFAQAKALLDQALADADALAAEVQAIRHDYNMCGATASPEWRAAINATDASGALTRAAERSRK